LFSKNLQHYNFHKIGDKNKMKNYCQVSKNFYNKYLKKMKLNMKRLIIFKRKILMKKFLKKIIKKKHLLRYHYNNQYNKILKIIKIIDQILKINIFKLII